MVFDECYALPVFLEQSSAIIEDNMVKGTTAMWREKIFHEDFAPELDLDIPFKGVDQLTSILCSMERDTKTVLDRFKNLSPVDRAKIVATRYPRMTWKYTDELTDLKFQYLASFVDRIKKVCEDVVSDQESAKGTLKKAINEYRDGLKLRNLKANVVKTNIPYYMTPKDMLEYHTGVDMEFNDTIATNELVRFLLEFYNIRLKSTSKAEYKEESFVTVSKIMKGEFGKSISRVQMLKESILATVSKDLYGSVEVFFYTIDTILLQLAQYVVAIYMRTLSAYISNMREIMKMVSLMDMKTGDVSSVVTESVVEIMDTCTLEKPTDIIKATENLMTAMTNTQIINAEDLQNTAGISTDSHTYKFPILTFKTLDKRLKTLILLCRDDKESSIGDLLSDCALSESNICELFANVNRAENVNFLKSVEFNPGLIYKDLDFMKNYIPRISEAFAKISDGVIVPYIHALETNVNGVFPNSERNKEVIEFLRKLLERISAYGRDLGQAYVRRLKSIGEQIQTDNEVNIDLEPDMYFADAIASSYRVITEYSEAVDEVNQRYSKLYVSTTIGNQFFEDDNAQNNNSQNNNDQNKDQKPDNQNAANVNSGNNDKNKNPQKASVSDPGPSNNGNNSNPDNNNNNSGSADNKGEKKSIIKRLQDFVTDTIDKLTDYFEKKGAKKKNLDFLNLHEKFLKARNYVNTRINVLPYLKNSDYTKKAQEILDAIAGIDEQTLKTADEKTLMNRVFSKFKLPDGDASVDAKLTQVFKIGSAKPVTITIENNALKAEIPGMLDFVDNYYNHFIDKFSSLKDGVNKLSDLDGKNGSDQNDRTEANKSLLTTWAMSSIRAARAAARDHANDIMLIMSGLAKSDPNNKGNDNNQPTSESNDNSEEEKK